MPFPSAEHQWKPGQSGNPAGRPRRRPISDRILELLEQNSLDQLRAPEGKTLGDLVAAAYLIAAINGSAADRRELTDRVEGRARLAGGETGDSGARAALRAEALDLTRARQSRADDRAGGDTGDPGQPQG